MSDTFAEVLLPIPLRGRFTYFIPGERNRKVIPFMRVIVPLGKYKQSVGLIISIHQKSPPGLNIKEITALPDDNPVIHPLNFEFWQWIARYYLCTEGDVLNAAMPSGLKLDRYRPKLQTMVTFHPEANIQEKWEEILGKLNRASKQKELLLQVAGKINRFSPEQPSGVPKVELLKEGRFSEFLLNQLIAKKILLTSEVPLSRLLKTDQEQPVFHPLNFPQEEVFGNIRQQFSEKNVVLLNDISGSGKATLYIQYIREILESGKQILFLVPEIAHAPQSGHMLYLAFRDKTGIYHSGMNEAERTETWNEVYRFKEDHPSPCQIILGTRSAIFLPFSRLGLIIVDDEHDSSFKQTDPSPRYHARDMAVVLGLQHQCPVLLGSATPSYESWHNAVTGKYGLVTLQERSGNYHPPQMVISDLDRARKKKQMHSILTPELYSAMNEALSAGEQIILIQNRRGFGTLLECYGCGHIPVCPECNIKLTFHLKKNRLICHYCGYKIQIPEVCPVCGSADMKSRGLGTEKVENEIAALFPETRIARLDIDTAPTRYSVSRIINRLKNKDIDILVGTQMVIKGLEFSNVGLVGILNADLLLNVPDFRSWEKAFQLFRQITGRLTGENRQAKVIIQTSHPDLPFYQYLISRDYEGMYNDQSAERKIFRYPPWYRLIRVILKHRDYVQLESVSACMAEQLRAFPLIHVLGPQAPETAKHKGFFVMEIWIKASRDTRTASLHEIIQEVTGRIKKMQGNSSLFITIDVDPV